MNTPHTGSCHCGAVRYRATLDLQQGTFKCNCSICSKSRAWLAPVSEANFELVQGEEALRVYQFGRHRIEHNFCTTCGTRVFGKIDHEGKVSHAILVATLDDVAPRDLAALPITYFDGKHDRFDRAPDDVVGL